MIMKEGQIMFLRRTAGCRRCVLVVVVVSVLLGSACTPASEGEEGGEGGGSPDAAREVPGSPASSPSSQQALSVLEEVFTGEELGDLREVFTEEELVELAGQFSGEELVELLGPESSEAAASEFLTEAIKELWENFDADDESSSDETLRAWAFLGRAVLGSDPLGIDANDVSTSVGAFCWVVLRLRWVMPSKDTVDAWWFGGPPDMEWWYIDSFILWEIERTVAGRGLELGWETGATGYNRSLRRFLLQATDPEIRDVVFSEGLPTAFRGIAESFYDYFDLLLELPVYRARPKVEEISGYPALAGLTGEEIRGLWPEILEVKLSRDDYEGYLELLQLLEDDEVRGLLNSECSQRTLQERLERACPPWVAEAFESIVEKAADVFSGPLVPLSVSDGIRLFSCTLASDFPQYWETNSDCLFGCPGEVSRERSIFDGYLDWDGSGDDVPGEVSRERSVSDER